MPVRDASGLLSGTVLKRVSIFACSGLFSRYLVLSNHSPLFLYSGINLRDPSSTGSDRHLMTQDLDESWDDNSLGKHSLGSTHESGGAKDTIV